MGINDTGQRKEEAWRYETHAIFRAIGNGKSHERATFIVQEAIMRTVCDYEHLEPPTEAIDKILDYFCCLQDDIVDFPDSIPGLTKCCDYYRIQFHQRKQIIKG